MRCLFKQACGKDLEFHSACGSLSGKFVMRLRSDIKSDGYRWPPPVIIPVGVTQGAAASFLLFCVAVSFSNGA
jgi:hypothetical protein